MLTRTEEGTPTNGLSYTLNPTGADKGGSIDDDPACEVV
jgi:hypothetical protein